MEYFYARWIHDNSDCPIEFFSELDDQRYETRKVELYRDGRFGIASDTFQIGDTELGEVPIPPLEEINEQEEFEARPITGEEFEEQWQYFSKRADPHSDFGTTHNG